MRSDFNPTERTKPTEQTKPNEQTKPTERTKPTENGAVKEVIASQSYRFSRLSCCWGARALVVFSVYSAILSEAVAAMSRLLLPMRKT